MICKICTNHLSKIFEAKILDKYLINYYQCDKCSFIQTEDPYWLKEAYHSPITKLDIGIIWRNINFSNLSESIIINYFNPNGKFIDYGGGYGIFVRLMRDKGFDFYRQDIYCANIFAEFFDVSDFEKVDKFEILTAFEVFEHLVDPIAELSIMLNFADAIIFSTELQPCIKPNLENWWYFLPETGQHISLYSRKSLDILASHFDLHVYSNDTSIHLFTKKQLKSNPFKVEKNPIVKIWKKIYKKKNNLGSLLMADLEYVKSKLI